MLFGKLVGTEVVPVKDAREMSVDLDERKVGRDYVDDYLISTVFLGINHGSDDLPQWFETMVFRGNSSSDLAMDRYATHAEAVAGHARMVERVKRGCMQEGT